MTDVTEWKNRIISMGTKKASQFVAHPLNHRRHPQRQRSAVRGSLDTLGWIDVVLVNAKTGNTIDGHERIWQALKNNDAEVPYIEVELTEAEEAQALLSLDAIAALAETDGDNVQALLEQVQTDNADVMKFLSDFAAESGILIPDLLSDEDAFGKLPDSDRAPFRQVTFTLHDSQFEQVEDALKVSKAMGAFTDSPNENSNGNAIARICETFLTEHGNG